MQNLIFVFSLVLNLYACIKNNKKGLVEYLVLSQMIPNLHIGGVVIPYDLLAGVLIIAVVGIKSFRGKVTVGSKVVGLYLAMYIVFCISTLLASLLFATPVLIIRLLGAARYVLLLLILVREFHNENFSEYLGKVLFAIMTVNIVAVTIQIMVPSSVSIFYDFYFQESATPLGTVVELGHFNRAYGTFASPVNLGTWSLFSFSFFLAKIMGGEKGKIMTFGAVFALACGLCSSTKTFIIGAPIIAIVCLALQKKMSVSRMLKICIGVIGAFYLLTIAIPFLNKMSVNIYYYLEYLKEPLRVFDTRYGVDSNSTRLMEAFSNSPIFGYGATNPGNYFVGDSEYNSNMYNAGIIGMIISLGIYIGCFIKKDRVLKTLTISFLLSGFALPMLFTLVGVLLCAYAANQHTTPKNALRRKVLR